MGGDMMKITGVTDQQLAILGGPKAVQEVDESAFPLADRHGRRRDRSVPDVLRFGGTMSFNDITMKFEQEYAQWAGVRFAAAGSCNGTTSVHEANRSGIELGPWR